MEDNLKFSKKDIENIFLGLTEYINYSDENEDPENYQEVNIMLEKINRYLDKK